jgi:hypothetical protein
LRGIYTAYLQASLLKAPHYYPNSKVSYGAQRLVTTYFRQRPIWLEEIFETFTPN